MPNLRLRRPTQPTDADLRSHPSPRRMRITRFAIPRVALLGGFTTLALCSTSAYAASSQAHKISTAASATLAAAISLSSLLWAALAAAGLAIAALLWQLSKQKQQLQQQQFQVQAAQIFTDLSGASIVSLSEVEPLLQKSLAAARTLLKAERMGFYRVKTGSATLEQYDWPSDWQYYVASQGWIAAESIEAGLTSASDYPPDAEWLPANAFQPARRSPVVFNNTLQGEMDLEHRRFLHAAGAKASLNVPVFHDTGADGTGKHETILWGYLIVHHCSQSHLWQTAEVSFVQQLSVHLQQLLYRIAADVNIRRSHAATQQSKQQAQQAKQEVAQTKQIVQQTQHAAAVINRQKQQQQELRRQQKEQLNAQISKLSRDIQGVFQGDLTIRTPLSQGELKTIAEAFNLTVAKLESLISQAKQSTDQINRFFNNHEHTALQLAKVNQQQTQESLQTLETIRSIKAAMASVVSDAQQAAQAAHQVATSAAAGKQIMTQTATTLNTLNKTTARATTQISQLIRSGHNVSYMTTMMSDIAAEMQQLSSQATRDVEALVGTAALPVGRQQPLADTTAALHKLSQKAVSESRLIDTFLTSVQQNTAGIIEALHQIDAQVLASSQAVDSTQQNLDDVFTLSHQFETLAQSVTQATEQQSQASQTAVALVTDVVNLSEQTSDFSQAMARSLQDNSQTAQKLRELISTFSVSEPQRLAS
ncbi:MAG: GAF domain-containing protein [Cyanobacteria bacterium J06606_4]